MPDTNFWDDLTYILVDQVTSSKKLSKYENENTIARKPKSLYKGSN